MRAVVLTFIAVALAATGLQAATLELTKGDHICVIGNTLGERMQHHGWLETLLHARFPKHELVVRNLAYSADEVDLGKRLRSMSFGTPDEWLSGESKIPQPGKLTDVSKASANRFGLTNTKADVIFMFFGYNESFAGADGIDNFRKQLEGLLKDTQGKKYNGKSAPRIVLFSPIAHEDLKSPNFPNGQANNERLGLYTQAMKQVAQSNNVVFVDLFTPSQELYAKAAKPLTINGIHLNEEGDKQLAPAIDRALFGDPAPHDAAMLEKIRQAVLDKNFHWYHRYRTTDGYSTYGDRAFLKFVDGQSNYEVIQRELETLDVMTSNRDGRVWAVAQGGDLKVDDGNTPPFIPVKTNKPGKGPNGTHLFLGAAEAIGHMKVAEGMQVNVFASEEQFPDLVKPVQMAWDTKNRLFVATWPSYPHWKPKNDMNDKLLVLEDTNGDGQADTCKVWADKLHNPTGFEFWNGGILVAQTPDLMFLKDTDGDDKCDYRERVLHGLDTADTHHTANSFVFDQAGAVYFQEGTFHHTQVETPWTAPRRVANGAVFRFEPRTSKFDVYVSYGFANPHGHVFDYWGQDFVTDGTGNANYYATAFSGDVDYGAKHGGMQTYFKQDSRPCAGTEILTSRHFPEANQGNLLIADVINSQAILQYRYEDDGSGFKGVKAETIVKSTDPNFRPSDMEMGPDGALYFAEWQNPIIGHMQHNLRDPSRDHEHGRVYRITCKGRELLKPVKIADEPIEKLLDLLKEPENRVRYRVRLELGARNAADVAAAAKKWIAGLDKNDKNYEHQVMEALWVHGHVNVVDQDLLKRMLRSPEPRARAAATRMLCNWRDRVEKPLDLLAVQAADDHPRVRLEAIRALSFFQGADVPQALEVAVSTVALPQDYYLEYTLKETMNTLEKRKKK